PRRKCTAPTPASAPEVHRAQPQHAPEPHPRRTHSPPHPTQRTPATQRHGIPFCHTLLPLPNPRRGFSAPQPSLPQTLQAGNAVLKLVVSKPALLGGGITYILSQCALSFSVLSLTLLVRQL